MRFLAETNVTDEIFEIETDHDEFTPQALRDALGLQDPQVAIYSKVLSGMLGRNRCIIVTQSHIGQVRIEVYSKRSALE